MCGTSQTANYTFVLNGVPQSWIVQQRNAMMTETVIAFPRSKEGLTKLVRSILGDIVTIAAIQTVGMAKKPGPRLLASLARRSGWLPWLCC